MPDRLREDSSTLALRVAEAVTDTEIARCFPVMAQLRVRFSSETDFVSRVRLQQAEGYRLVFLEDAGEIVATAGYRIIENLSAGRVLYVDDLVTDALRRSKGYGAKLLDWLADRARSEGCDKLDLDSGVQRGDAHRFYHTQGLKTFAHHFRLDL
jgi:GNAT superfamily N-acetyltransferase